MSIFDVLFGKPLATSAEHDEHIGVAAGIPIFGLDGLTSAAYGPEAAMTLLIPLGFAAGVYTWLLPVFTAILILLVLLYFSYRQTIVAYPNGGGSFTVASENLGDGAGLLAAAKNDVLVALRLEGDRQKTAARMGAVAKRLRLGAPATAPEVALSCFDLPIESFAIRNDRGSHANTPSLLALEIPVYRHSIGTRPYRQQCVRILR